MGRWREQGCKRRMDNIAAWKALKPEERAKVLNAMCEALRAANKSNHPYSKSEADAWEFAIGALKEIAQEK